MANKFRYVYGDTKPVKTGPIAPDTVVEIGDFVDKDGNLVDLSDGVEVANFLGISGQQSRNGDTDSIRVSTAGTYEHPCMPDTFEIGDLVTPGYKQRLVKTDPNFPEEAIGIVERQYTTPTSSVVWRITSKIMAGT